MTRWLAAFVAWASQAYGPGIGGETAWASGMIDRDAVARDKRAFRAGFRAGLREAAAELRRQRSAS